MVLRNNATLSYNPEHRGLQQNNVLQRTPCLSLRQFQTVGTVLHIMKHYQHHICESVIR